MVGLLVLFASVGWEASAAHAELAEVAASLQPEGPCQAGLAPRFVLGFAALAVELGPVMGEPLECERSNPENGDTLQRTTTGLAFYRKSTNTPTFTDGTKHWALTQTGLTFWSGAAVDPPATTLAGCFDVGGRQCLRGYPGLSGVVAMLETTADGTRLLEAAADAGVQVRRGLVPPQSWAAFSPRGNSVILGLETAAYPPREQSPLLAHELEHASDWVTRRSELGTAEGCYGTERRAFETEARVWEDLTGGELPSPPGNELQEQLNTITRAVTRNPEQFAEQLTRVYGYQCEGI